MKLPSFPALVLAAGSWLMLFSAGCSTPASIKDGSTHWVGGTRDLGKQYKADLKDIRERLETADAERAALITNLAQARASQKLMRDALLADQGALKFAQALERYDTGAAKLLGEDFEQAFQNQYLLAIRPKLDAAAKLKTDTEQAALADPANAAKMKEAAFGIARLLALRLQVLEDYRRLRRDAVAQFATQRGSLIAELRAKLPASSFTPDDAAFSDHLKQLLNPELTVAVPTPPSLATGLAARESEISQYTESLNSVAAEVDKYLQTDGWRREIIDAFVQQLIGEIKGAVGQALPKAQAGVVDIIKDKLPIPGLAAAVGGIDLNALSDQALAKGQAAIVANVVNALKELENRITTAIGPKP